MLSGRELLDWSSLLEIEPHSLITTFHMDGNTFVIVAHKVSLTRVDYAGKLETNTLCLVEKIPCI